MTAEIVSVGTELLLGQITDTNAQHLGKVLAELGIPHQHRQTVGDNRDRLVEALRLALRRSDIVLTIGGLGPTQDDITREAVASALNDEIIVDEAALAGLREFFSSRGLPWVDSQIRQAWRPACGRLIENPNGTAPGMICEKGSKVVVALPGPRGEFVAMVDGPVRDALARFGGGEVILSRLIRICGLGESLVEERVRDLLESSNPSVAPYAHPGEVHLRITARAKSSQAAQEMIAPVEEQIKAALGTAVFGTDETTLEAAVIELLSNRNATVAVAESMTGGGLGERFTNVAGSGDAFLGGFITYDLGLKKKLLGISAEILDNPEIGPVSEKCAREMAARIRELTGATYGVSITGNAGPTSDKGAKPIGMTYIGVAGPGGVEVEEHQFRGQREFIRRRAEQASLAMLRRIVMTS
ncbi:MAG: competence/damage-inducible protein A [Fimbriimonadaceae bacterium]